MSRFVLLPERGNKNNSLARMGIEPTTVVITVRLRLSDVNKLEKEI